MGFQHVPLLEKSPYIVHLLLQLSHQKLGSTNIPIWFCYKILNEKSYYKNFILFGYEVSFPLFNKTLSSNKFCLRFLHFKRRRIIHHNQVNFFLIMKFSKRGKRHFHHNGRHLGDERHSYG